jgi:hypothetical protein
MSRSTRRRLLAVGLVPVLTFTMSCGKAADKVSEKAAEKAAEKALEGAGGGNVDIGKDGQIKIETKDGTYQTDADGNVRIETEDGTTTAGQGLPEGWPDDVPIPKDASVSYGSSSPDGLMVTLTVPGSPGDTYDELTSALDGWSAEDEYSATGSGSDMRSAQFVDGERTVTVSIISNGEDGSDGSTVSLIYAPTGAN